MAAAVGLLHRQDGLASASAGHGLACLAASARRMADCFSPSATRICWPLLPSAWRMASHGGPARPSSAFPWRSGCLAGRDDVLQLHPVDLDAPWVGGLVQNGAHLGVDDVPAGEGLIQLHIADDIAQRGGRQVLNGAHRVLDTVGIQLGVGDLEVDDGIDLHGDVILGDDGLGIEVGHLLLQADLLHHALDERQLEVQTHAPNAVEGAEALHHVGLGLLDHVDAADDDHQNDDHQNDDGDGARDVVRHMRFLLISSSLFWCAFPSCSCGSGG